ncbi:protein of unknown function [Nitrospina watsonii]|uniref:Uncharacterized protein n=1 Tax=Nitrospina watsonii TaxID=1323948 RepID=A0ABM9HD41_9BACT|nr:protein of unknown function [Nitrospina watsonii]
MFPGTPRPPFYAPHSFPSYFFDNLLKPVVQSISHIWLPIKFFQFEP